ncbi:peptide chain release factor N(5)-glutamine methyltransferase [Enterococcus sp. 669A]|uniref:Release factor glutamine methyltransferase n=1 Tax=Candidatus Enterococcus moelleringii TaxID=2815325 RepID=A0ABS3L5M9_9ENTE|nr:peptide chain release factor N(5)-glutamine methyltransferase [Enterococcus sp. 669A]MBO1304926.1 peptide chain release factor N(5)-glutamine methyltransferase [Enterococcus sp. 669A]
MAKTYVEVLSRASSFLEEAGLEGYGIEYLFLERKGWDKTQWLLHMRDEISPAEEAVLQGDMEQLLNHFPPQYMLGYSDFLGHRFKVTKDTLIPRPETEELVMLCLEKNPGTKLKVVDIGTGTGAIAISLKLARPDWQVTAVDISAGALAVAEENARGNGVEIDFRLGDTLSSIDEPQDIIISNPPYISPAEWALMDESVRTFEPKQALFAENEGLAIYQKIAEESPQRLKPEGMLLLEIGFQQGEAVRQMMQQAFPDKQVEVKKDLSKNDRMVIVC